MSFSRDKIYLYSPEILLVIYRVLANLVAHQAETLGTGNRRLRSNFQWYFYIEEIDLAYLQKC